MQALSSPGVVASEDGVPLVVDGKLAGATGVNCATSEQDGVVAATGAALR